MMLQKAKDDHEIAPSNHAQYKLHTPYSKLHTPNDQTKFQLSHLYYIKYSVFCTNSRIFEEMWRCLLNLIETRGIANPYWEFMHFNSTVYNNIQVTHHTNYTQSHLGCLKDGRIEIARSTSFKFRFPPTRNQQENNINIDCRL